MNILQELQSRLADALVELTDSPEEFASMVRPTADPKFRDFQANCAMPLAKKLGKNPREVAQDIVQRLNVADLCTEPEVAGPGFINLTLRRDWMEARLAEIRQDARLGVPPAACASQVCDRLFFPQCREADACRPSAKHRHRRGP